MAIDWSPFTTLVIATPFSVMSDPRKQKKKAESTVIRFHQ